MASRFTRVLTRRSPVIQGARCFSSASRFAAPTTNKFWWSVMGMGAAGMAVGANLYSSQANAAPEKEALPAMEYRRMGSAGLKISALSLGTFVLFNKGNEDAAYQVFKQAIDAGVNFIDTAETYGKTRGDCSINLGEFIRKANIDRHNLVVSTKIFWGGDTVTTRGLSRKHIIEGVDAELKRLKLDYVDVVFAHRPDPDTPIEETVRAFNHVIEQGKAFYWGTSAWSPAQVKEAFEVAERLKLIPPQVEQPEYNLLCTARVEKELVPYYEKGLGLTTYSPLAMGLLTGKYNNGVPQGSRFDKVEWLKKARYDRPDINDLVGRIKRLEGVAKKLDSSLTQLSLAWCLRNPRVSSVIMGASGPAQVRENVKSLAVLAKLTPEVVKEIDDIINK